MRFASCLQNPNAYVNDKFKNKKNLNISYLTRSLTYTCLLNFFFNLMYLNI